MRIGLHLQSLRPGAIGGHETYARQLVRLLPEIDPQVRLVLFCADYNAATFAPGPQVEVEVLDDKQFATLDAAQLRWHHLDVWFCPLLVLDPAEPGLPAVVDIPDLQHEAYPEFFPERILAWRRQHYPRSARRADAILTGSEFCRQQIVDSLDVPPSRVHAIHLDAAPAFDNGAVANDRYLARVRSRYRLPDQFLLYPANDWPHKNHVALFDALCCDDPRVDPSLQLVLTGAFSNGADPHLPLLRQRRLEHRVRHLGYVADEDLPGLYALAHALVFPSLFEGFGLPVIEAFRAGCPVLCSNAASLPEVAGEDAALYFDPRRPAELAEAITRLTPRRRRRLVQAGHRRAQAFSWEQTAHATLEVMRRVAAPPTVRVHTDAQQQPLISIVTPSLQQGRFIERTLKSVLEQEYGRVEHWVIDGGSTDETLDILERYKREHPDRLHYISEPDEGQAAAINKGIARARGDIVGWINSDDTYQPGSFAAVARAFRDDPDCDLVYGRARFISDSDERLWEYPTRPRFEWHGLAHECYLCQPTVFWRRAVTDGGHRLDESLQLALDYDLWIRLGRHFDFHFVDRELANSRVYPETKTFSQRTRVYEESFEVVKRHFGWLPFSWTLGRAHYRRDGGDAFFNVRPVAPLTYLAAIASLVRHNASSPRHWRTTLRDLWPVIAQAPRALRRLLAPSARHGLTVAADCLIVEIGVEVTRRADDASKALDLWCSGHRLARFAVNGPGTYTWCSSLPYKEGSGPYRMKLTSDLLRIDAARPLEPRAFPVVAADRWLEQQDTLRLPAGWTDVELTFMLPVDPGGDIELCFESRRRTIAQWTFERPGTYRRRLRLPAWATSAGDATEIKFTSNAALPPDPARGEPRRLAARVQELIDRSPGAAKVRG